MPELRGTREVATNLLLPIFDLLFAFGRRDPSGLKSK
jgi:hypothetical protein